MGHMPPKYMFAQKRLPRVGDEISLKIERDGEALDKQLKLKGFSRRQ
jgi:hypothetical protein